MLVISLLAALFLGQPDGSVAWKIHTEGTSMCCCDGQTFSKGRDDLRRTTEIYVVAQVKAGTIRDLRLLSTECTLRDAKLLENVSAEASLDALRAQLDRDGTDENEIVLAIAMHDHPRVAGDLLSLARNHASSDVRQAATFWLGQKAGEKAASDLRSIVDDDPDDEVRERAVFAISQLPRSRSVPMLIDLVRKHRRGAVRERAMFWLTQTGDPRALDLIAEILGVE